MRQLKLTTACVIALAGFTVPVSSASASLRLGFQDYKLEALPTPEFAAGLQNGSRAGASIWRFVVYWRATSPQKPPSLEQAADPSWQGYNWSATDRIAKAVAAAGLQPLATVTTAPDWAQADGAPPPSRTFRPGAWKPSSSWFGAFAEALARRYSGSYPDPTAPGATLPRIGTWQVWNEPNLSIEISPQWKQTARGPMPASPGIYRQLLNAFYRGVKSVTADSEIVTAGTAPYGDLNAGDPRMMPVRFWRELLCVSNAKVPKAKNCPKISFDAIAHHPYPIGPPRRTARNADDAVVPDVKKITRLLPAATRRGTIRPAGAKPLWITEISWDSRPDPDGVSLEQQATYLQGALYVLYQQGADVVTWFNLRDQAPTPSYAATYQSGVFLRGSTPAEDVAKPSYTAFRFPFTAYRTRGVARLWGMAPAGGDVTIQARQGDRWVTAARLRAAGNRIFTGRLRVGQGVSLRAVWNNDTSLVWRTF